MTATELGQALRRWRDRVAPESAGLPSGGHRRAAGLRREELALLAGISVDYVTRLEQGRASSPSGQIVEVPRVRLEHDLSVQQLDVQAVRHLKLVPHAEK